MLRAIRIFMVSSAVCCGMVFPAFSAWTANWIWQSGSGPANTWMAFRKTFTLTTVPASAIANIGVDSKYWLWINGQLAVFEGGLKRGPTPNDTYYDSVDIAKYLQTGANTIAVLVWFWGKSGSNNLCSGNGGLVFEGNFGGTLVRSDNSWKMRAYSAYETTTADPQPNGAYSESNVRFNAQNDSLSGWTLPGYDDSGWRTPVLKGVPPIAPWNNLWSRPIPQWKNLGLNNYTGVSVSLPYTATATTVIVGKLPYNAQITAYLKLNSTAGKVIDMRTDAYHDGGNISGSDQRYGVRAEYVTKSGEQDFEELAWVSGHEMHYTIPPGVTVEALQYRETGYNTEFTGSFNCNDDFLNTLWTKARRTVYVNMRDNFMDCPTRERCQWWGDLVVGAGESFYSLDRKSDDLIRKGISNLIEWRKSGTVLHAPIPGTYDPELPQQILASVGKYGFWFYYLYSGDSASIANAYPHVKDYLHLWTIGGDGLVNHRAGDWDWGDWGDNIDMKVMENAWYFMALQAASSMAQLTGNIGDVTWYATRKTSIQNNYNTVLWNGTAYRATDFTGQTDERGNALAVLAGLADSAKWSAIRTVLHTSLNASPYMEKYVLEALYTMGFAEDAILRMKSRYNAMVTAANITTLWEFWDLPGQGTYNHEWAGGPLTLLSQFGAGIAPESVGFATYHVLPQLGPLTSVSAVVPSVKGLISTGDTLSGNQFIMHLTSPSSTIATVGMPQRDNATILTVTANGTTIWQNGTYTGGVAGIASAGANARYLEFTANPGAWTFVATYDKALPTVNLASGATVTGCTSLESSDWGVAKLTDGITTSVTGAKGYTSDPPRTGPNNHECVTIDLGKNTAFNRIKMYPRTDVKSTTGVAPNWPADFTIQVEPDGGSYAMVQTVTNDSNNAMQAKAYDFTKQNARYIKIDVTKLGVPASGEVTSYRFQLAEVEAYNIVTVSSRPRTAGFAPVKALGMTMNNRQIVFHVACPGAYALRIFDAAGKTHAIYRGRDQGSFVLARTMLSRGVYFAQLTSAGGRVIKEIAAF